MEAVSHNPQFAKKVGVSQSVGKDFVEADKSQGFKSMVMKRGKRNGI